MVIKSVYTGPMPSPANVEAYAKWADAQREAYWNPPAPVPKPAVIRPRTWNDLTKAEVQSQRWMLRFFHLIRILLCVVFGHSKRPLIIVRGVPSRCARCAEDLKLTPAPWSAEELAKKEIALVQFKGLPEGLVPSADEVNTLRALTKQSVRYFDTRTGSMQPGERPEAPEGCEVQGPYAPVVSLPAFRLQVGARVLVIQTPGESPADTQVAYLQDPDNDDLP